MHVSTDAYKAQVHKCRITIPFGRVLSRDLPGSATVFHPVPLSTDSFLDADSSRIKLNRQCEIAVL